MEQKIQTIEKDKMENFETKHLENFLQRCLERKASTAEICEFLYWFIKRNLK